MYVCRLVIKKVQKANTHDTHTRMHLHSCPLTAHLLLLHYCTACLRHCCSAAARCSLHPPGSCLHAASFGRERESERAAAALHAEHSKQLLLCCARCPARVWLLEAQARRAIRSLRLAAATSDHAEVVCSIRHLSNALRPKITPSTGMHARLHGSNGFKTDHPTVAQHTTVVYSIFLELENAAFFLVHGLYSDHWCTEPS
jgi:hypothetical protein